MAAASTILVAGGLALAVAGTGVQFVAGRRQAKAQEDAAEQQRAIQQLEQRRQRRRVLRERRIARAQTQNVAAQTGAQGSSGELGGLTSLEAQAGFETGVLTASESASSNIFAANRRAARAGQLGSIGQGMASIGGTAFSTGQQMSGGRALGRIFGGGRSAPTLQTTSTGLGFAGPRI